ncbi:TPA: capZB protein [Neisseria meningitidis]
MKSLKKLANSCKKSDLVQTWLHIRRNTAGTKEKRGLKQYYLIHQAIQAISEANHPRIEDLSMKLIEGGDSIGYFYYAQSLALQNKIVDAAKQLNIFLKNNPYHADATYLLADIEVRQNNKQHALNLLEHLLQHNARRKTWQHISNLVENSEDFLRYLQLFNKFYPNHTNKPLRYDLICHLSNAALRGGQQDFALNLWREQYQLAQSQKLKHNLATPPKYTDEKAAKALSDLKRYLDKAQIPFFLISGTLLGCIRENKLLGHDKDIDIGVWEDQTLENLQDIFRKSGCFYTLPIYSPDILVIRHINGITIDIFIHYREQNSYWHAGKKTKWHNSPFELIQHPFLENHYLIPKNYDLYLTENYGSDWRIPRINFDSALDTPNIEILSKEEFIIYLYKQLLSPKRVNPEMARRLKDNLIQQKEVI